MLMSHPPQYKPHPIIPYYQAPPYIPRKESSQPSNHNTVNSNVYNTKSPRHEGALIHTKPEEHHQYQGPEHYMPYSGDHNVFDACFTASHSKLAKDRELRWLIG